MNIRNKIVTAGSLQKKIAKHRREGKKIAFTNGCFDILHFGHVHYLEKAKKPGRILIVGLNSDRSIKSIKDPGRPVVTDKQRAGVLAGLSSVDYVVIFNEPTPVKLIQQLRPDVLIKGADWKGKKLAGQSVVKKVELIRYLPNISTTNIIRKITSAYAK